jgi:DNA invertase Pin-like site-specific DNA recombinase
LPLAEHPDRVDVAVRSLAALLEYARQGDTIVVVGIDRFGRNSRCSR